MANKTLNTRISLKYDSYSNWQANNPVLLAGEVAIATIPTSGTSQTVSGSVSLPQVLIKVGDGKTAYNSLPFASALAADVYSWAKAATKPTYSASEITGLEDFIAGEIQDTDLDTRYDFSIVDGKLRVTSTLYTKGVAGTPTTKDLDFVTPEELTSALTPYAKSTDVTSAIETAKSEAISTAANDATTKANAAEANAKAEVTTLANGAVASNTSAINTLNGAATVAGSVKKQVADALQAAKDYADANDANATYSLSYNSSEKKIYLTGANGGSTTSIDASAFIKDGMIDSVAISGTGKDQVLVITWNSDSGKTTTEIELSSLVDIYTGVDGTTTKVTVSSDNKIGAEVKNGSITEAHLSTSVNASLDLADSAVQSVTGSTGSDMGTFVLNVDGTSTTVTVKGIDALNAKVGNFDPNTNGTLYSQVVAVGRRVDDLEAKESTWDAKISKVQNSDGTITVTPNPSDATQVNVAISSTYKNKIDSAVQTITPGTGLKATKTGTDVALDIDDTTTFIFNCGDSTNI